MTRDDAATEAALARAMAELWTRYRSAALERVVALERAGDARATGSLDPQLAEAARAEAHKLVGSLGSFGIHEGTALAREAERLLTSGDAADPGRLRAIAAELRVIVETADPQPE